MSFFDDASLVLISDFAAASASMVSGSGANTGKAYSIKPTDGSGDFTFERGSDITATRVNSSGYIEKGRGNFLFQSNNFDTTPWNDGGEYTIESGQDGYDGTTDAWLLQKNTTGNDYLAQSSLSTDAVNTISFYAKEGSVRGVKVVCGGQNVNIDLRDGSIISTGGASNLIAAGADLVIGTTDWYRVYLTRPLTTIAVLIKPTDENGADSIGSIYIQDTQLERGLVATDYIETTTAPLRAGLLEDEPRFDYHNSASASPNTCPSLLLELSRTNLITNSEYIDASTDWNVNSVTVEDNSITSPENQTNAAKLTGTVGDNQKRIYQSFSQVSGSDFTTSIFAKEDTENILFLRLYNTTDNVYANASFNLSTGAINSNDSGTAKIENYGNGWYRCILTGTPSTTTTTGGAYFNLTSDGSTTSTTSLYLWGAQIEQASYATSYIPTYGTAATRGADTSIVTGVSSLIGQTEGTLFLDYEFLNGQAGENENWIALESENGQERVLIYKSAANNYFRAFLTANNSLVFNNPFSSITITPNTRYKIAFRYSSGDIAVAINGSLEFTDSSTYTRGSDLSRLTFNESNVEPSCRIHQAIVFDSGLTNLELATLTTL